MAWCLTNPNVSTCLSKTGHLPDSLRVFLLLTGKASRSVGASRLEQIEDNLGACRVARQLEEGDGPAILAEVRRLRPRCRWLARSDVSSLGQIEELLGNAPAEPRGMMEADYRLPLASPPSPPRALPARL